MKAPAPMKVMKAKQVGSGFVADALASMARADKVVETAQKAVEKAKKVQVKCSKDVKIAMPPSASSDEESSSADTTVLPTKRAKVSKVMKVTPVTEVTPEKEDDSSSSSSSSSSSESEVSEVAVAKAMKQVKKTVIAKDTKKAGGKAFTGKLAKTVGVALKQKKKSAAKKKEEKDWVGERTKELKAMKLADLKELVASRGLEKGIKEDMIQGVLGFEASLRAEPAAKEAKISGVVEKKRKELAGLAMAQLKDMLVDKALRVGGSKDERVDRLLAHWQEQGEVEKILEAEARDARKDELCNMDKVALKNLCEKIGVDTLVKEVLVERILMHERLKAAEARMP